MKRITLLIFILLRLQKFQNFADIADYIVCTGLAVYFLCFFFPLFSLFRGKILILLFGQSQHRTSLQDSHRNKPRILPFQNIRYSISHFHNPGYFL